jgi:hypothetical protein
MRIGHIVSVPGLGSIVPSMTHDHQASIEQQVCAKRTEALVLAIRALEHPLNELADGLLGVSSSFDRWSAVDWCRKAFRDALMRLRLMAQQNFASIETMGLLASARYVFELSVWLHLLRADSRYGLVYYHQLGETQTRYYRDYLEHLRREVELLKTFHRKDQESMDALARVTLGAAAEGLASGRMSPSDVTALITASAEQAMCALDGEASRSFSLFLDGAATNGYGLQAHLVETQAIPETEQAIRLIEQEMDEFRRRVPREIQSLSPRRWEWRQMARQVGLATEYDYIYCYASKLLHATPASVSTDQVNLDIPEVYLFVRYTHSKLLAIMDLAREETECQQRARGQAGRQRPLG